MLRLHSCFWLLLRQYQAQLFLYIYPCTEMTACDEIETKCLRIVFAKRKISNLQRFWSCWFPVVDQPGLETCRAERDSSTERLLSQNAVQPTRRGSKPGGRDWLEIKKESFGSLSLWTSQGLNLGPPDYEYLKVIFYDISLFWKCTDNQRFTKTWFSLNIRKYP